MKVLRFAATLYTAILLALLLFPPWSGRPVDRHSSYPDPAFSSLGHHWRFTLPYHWGYQEDYCTDSYGRSFGCDGKSVWEADRYAVVDFRMLEYESILGFAFSVFLALIFDPMRAVLARPALKFKDFVSRIMGRETASTRRVIAEFERLQAKSRGRRQRHGGLPDVPAGEPQGEPKPEPITPANFGQIATEVVREQADAVNRKFKENPEAEVHFNQIS
jgi:hypothetical protein